MQVSGHDGLHNHDLNYDDLVREALALLPVHAPQWTDHNPSDPGITLIELLAYFVDILLYRTGRITPAARLQFLRLLTGRADLPMPTANLGDDGLQGSASQASQALACAIEDAVQAQAQMHCAVTPADFERFAMAAADALAGDGAAVARCIPNTNLGDARAIALGAAARGHVSVVVALPEAFPPELAATVRDAVRDDLLPRCLLTTRLHVLPPAVLHISIGLHVALMPGFALASVMDEIQHVLRNDAGGAQQFGGAFHLASAAAAIDRITGVDYVENLHVLGVELENAGTDASLGVQIGITSHAGRTSRVGGLANLGKGRLVRDTAGLLASVQARPWETLRVTAAPKAIVEIDRTTEATGNWRGRND